jgi:hypothetical protein
MAAWSPTRSSIPQPAGRDGGSDAPAVLYIFFPNPAPGAAVAFKEVFGGPQEPAA